MNRHLLSSLFLAFAMLAPIAVAAAATDDPRIVTQPVDCLVSLYNVAHFSVVAVGTGSLSYQWQRNGVDIPGAITPDYATPPIAAADSGTLFRVRVANALGTVTSVSVAATIAPSLPPWIVTPPVGMSVAVGGTATFSVSASQLMGTPLQYGWQRDGVPIVGSNGATTYTTPPLTMADDGATYRAIVGNNYGSVTSAAAVVRVSGPSAVLAAAPTAIAPGGVVTATWTDAIGASAADHIGLFPLGADDASPLAVHGTGGAGSGTFVFSAPSTPGSYALRFFHGTGALRLATSNPFVVTNTMTAPIILAMPAAQSIVDGQGATFSVIARGTGPLSYRWRRDGVDIPGANGPCLNLFPLRLADDGAQFSVVVSNAIASVVTVPVALTVRSTTDGMFLDWRFDEGSGTAIADASGNGNGATIVPGGQWTAGPTGGALTVNGGGQFILGSTDVGGRMGSGSQTIALWFKADGPGVILEALSAPSLTAAWHKNLMVVGPRGTFGGQTVASGTIASFSSVQLDQWHHAVIRFDALRHTVDGFVDGLPVTFPQHSDTYLPTTPVYLAVAAGTNDSPGYTSPQFAGSVADLRVYDRAITDFEAKALSGCAGRPPVLGQTPVDKILATNQQTFFSATALGIIPVPTQWLRDGVPIPGASGGAYAFTTSRRDQGAIFTAILTNDAGSITTDPAVVLLTDVPPSIVRQPTPQSVTVGAVARFSVTATGSDALTYQWFRNGAAIPGATLSFYETPAATATDSGASFSVVVGNAIASVTSASAALTVTTLPVAPSVATAPSSQTVLEGQVATFSVTGAGTAPLTYQWLRNGVAIPNANAETYTTFAMMRGDDGAVYRVIIANAVGSVTSGPASVTVRSAPLIVQQPVAQSVLVGHPATFAVTVSGTAPMSYQWGTIANGYNTIVGATSASYTTPNLVPADDGTVYVVQATNAFGATSSDQVRLTVLIPPTIIDQPVAVTVKEGQDAGFTVYAIGTAPLTYQWQRNGVDIPDAPNAASFYPRSIMANDGASYRVVVSNGLGTITSSAATFTVIPQPLPSFVNYSADDHVTEFYVNGSGSFTGPHAADWATTDGGEVDAPVTAVAIRADNASGSAGIIAEVLESDHSVYITDGTWRVFVGTPPADAQGRPWYAVDYDDSAWSFATSLGTYGVAPWAMQPGLAAVADAQWIWAGSPTATTVCARKRFAPTAPTISAPPANQSVIVGSTATFSVNAVGTAPLTYQWQRGAVAIAGATSASYTTPITTLSDTGSAFRCIVSNPIGSVTSSNAILTVGVPVARGPYGGTPWPVPGRIEAERFDDGGEGVAYHDTDAINQGGVYRSTGVDILSDANAQSGKAVGWIAAGEWLEYTVDVATTSIYTLSARVAQPGGGSTFHVSVDGSPLSGALTAPSTASWNTYAKVVKPGVLVAAGRHVLRVTFDTAAANGFCIFDYLEFALAAPVITVQPQSVTVAVGQPATFSVTATGAPPLTYQWQRWGNIIPGATASTYTTPPTTDADNATPFRCTIINGGGSVTTTDAVLTVGVVAVAPYFARPLKGDSTSVGQTITMSVEPLGTAPFTYQWRRAGVPIPGAVEFIYTTPPLTLADNGVEYSVVVSNAGGSASEATTIGVSADPPLIVSQPTAQTVVVGQRSTFRVVMAGSAPFTYRWQRDGVDIAGATDAFYTTPPAVVADDGAAFRVIVGNFAGTVATNEVRLFVLPVPPTIASQPVDQVVALGSSATFAVVAAGTAPLTYQWERRGVPIPGATAPSYSTPPTTTADNGATYRCVVVNRTDGATSRAATLTVRSGATRSPFGGTPWPVPGLIEAERFDEGGEGVAYHDTDAINSGNAYRTTGVDIYSDPAAQSGKAVGAIVAGEWLEYTVAVATTGSYTLTARVAQPGGGSTFHVSIDGANISGPLTAPDTGAWNVYKKIVKPGVALTAGPHVIRVSFDSVSATGMCIFDYTQFATDLPIITTQPSDATVAAGQPASFSVVATGTSALTYQWRRGGVAIVGATAASYTTPATTLADSGSQYACVVTTSAGSTLSASATLTVTGSAPTITSQPASLTILSGTTATFTVVAAGTGPLSFQWQRNGAPIAAATAATYTTPTVTTSDSGTLYSVVVSNSAGSVTSAPASLTVATALPTITSQPVNASVSVGQTATFAVVASSPTPITYQWTRSGIPIPGATAATFTTPPATMADNGVQFACAVGNSAGSVTSSTATLSVVAVVVRSPYGGTPWAIPGRIEGENFDVGAEGTAYHDTDAANLGGAYRSTGVDVYADPAAQAGKVVGNVMPGEWLEYTVNVTASATYALSARVALPGGGATFRVLIDGINVPGTLAVPDTGGWSSFLKVNRSGFDLTAGPHILRVVFDTPGPNGCCRFDYIEFTAVSPILTTQPGNATVAVGASAVFTVTAIGAAPLQYQWQRNGSAIPGANAASYGTPPAASADSGDSFRVVVTNPAGSVTSNPATITVGTAPIPPAIAQ